MSNPEFILKTLSGIQGCSEVELMFDECKDVLRVFVRSSPLNGNDYANMVRTLTNAFHWFSDKSLEFFTDAEDFFVCT